MANVILITHGTGGDVLPFVKLGKALKNLGYDVTLFTHCVYEKEAKENGLDFIAIDSYDEYREMNNSLPQLSDPINKLDEYLEFNRKYYGADKTYKEYMLISQYCKIENSVILFRHRSSLSGLLAAEKCGCPVASVFLAPNYISHLQLHEQLIGDSMRHELNKVRNNIGLTNINSWTEWMCSPKLKIALWPNWYEIEESKDIEGIHHIGFIINERESKHEIPKAIREVLDTWDKTVLITGGTSKLINPNFYKVAVDACIKGNLNAILVTPFEELLFCDLPPSILKVKSAPVKEIMPYVDVIIHHGGIGTASEAVLCGIPQLIMPHMVDRPDNADRLRRLGVAKVFPEINWKSEVIGNTLNDVIDSKVLSTFCKDLSYRMLEDDPKKELNSIIKELIENVQEYRINIGENTNVKINNRSNDMGKIHKENSSLDSVSEEKKRILVKLLMQKRKNIED